MSRLIQKRIGHLAVNVAVAVGAVITLVPLAWMVFSSFKTTTEIFTYPPWLMPRELSLFNYESLLRGFPFGRWYLNSIFYCAVVTVAVPLVCSLAGYAFAKLSFRGRRGLFLLVLASIVIPFQVILIPMFILMSQIGWVDTPYAMTIPWIAPALGIFLMRQYSYAIPAELLEAARIDGASEFRIYWQIVLPLLKNGLAALAIIQFLSSWNSYIWPLMVLRGQESMTLPVGLAGMQAQAAGTATPYGEMMAGATLASLPVIVLFLIAQRYLISGLTTGAVK